MFRPNNSVRRQLFDACDNGRSRDEIKALLASITIDQYEVLFRARATLDLTNDAVYAAVAGDFSKLRFPNPDDDDAAVLGVKVGTIYEEVSCTFVKALRDVVSDLRGHRNNPLLTLLRGTGSKVALKDSKKLIDTIVKLNEDIGSLPEIRTISANIQRTLARTVGHSYSPGIGINSSLPEDIERLLEGLTLKVNDPSDIGYRGDLFELSLGGANLIYLSLKLLEYESKLSSDRAAHFLLIEEPEAHIHTHIQKTLFDRSEYKNTQVIFSTHSTHISAASRIRSVNVLAKGCNEAHVFHPDANLTAGECSRIERYLDAVRSTLLLAKGVILVEGDAELVLVPALIKTVFGVSLDDVGVSLICMSSAVFGNVAAIFHADRIRRRCAIVTDSDESLITLPLDPANDSSTQKQSRSSQKSGRQRKVALEKFAGGNLWIKPLFAKHTFEVDFLHAGNVDCVTACLSTIYEDDARRASTKAKLQNKDRIESGVEILRLAKKKGKGWFAILLAEQLEPQSAMIPEYLTEAFAFVVQDTIDDNTLMRIIQHRAGLYEWCKEDSLSNDNVYGHTLDELIDAVDTALPADPVRRMLVGIGRLDDE